ncbi:MAG: M23 family metallopeptidase [Dehalococcoidia bacterium]|nr:M23 family metallopeptidase [Dehalococcoidia bacterium]
MRFDASHLASESWPMRNVCAAALLCIALLLVACGESASSAPITVQVSTATPTTPAPDPTATPPPGATPTTIPEPEVVLATDTVVQGGALLVAVTGNIRGGTAQLFGGEYPLTQGERSMYTFIGIPTDAPTGELTLGLRVETANGSTGELSETVTVQATEWTVESLEFDQGTLDELLDPEVLAEESRVLGQVYGTVTDEKLWEQTWFIPTDGPITARFGEQRSYNGSEPTGRRTGTDISAETGTRVVATNNGRVCMARELAVRGNMVVIDHGGGLLSGYAHLSEIGVLSQGDVIQAGDVIGAVGSTGLSTGAHLHWEMAIHGTRVDPWHFVDGTNGF